eukprot:symbB.v1.2.012957.t1/scaffold906.1/size153294/2
MYCRDRWSGNSLSCSDKVARWQFQGLEGVLLASLVQGPLRLSTISIGRKFDHASCVLALGWTSHPPDILQSTLSLEAALAAAKSSLGVAAPESEKGDGDESYVWSFGDVQAAIHDGRTGAALDSRGASRQTAPPVAGARFLQLYNSLPFTLGEVLTYKEAKQVAANKLGTSLERHLVQKNSLLYANQGEIKVMSSTLGKSPEFVSTSTLAEGGFLTSDAETEEELKYSTDVPFMSSIHHLLDGEDAHLQEAWTSAHSSRAALEGALFWKTLYDAPRPYRPARILCVARQYQRKSKWVDFVGELHLDLIQEFGGAPIIVPRTVRTLSSLLEYFPMDGLLVAEGSDISDEVLKKYNCSLPKRLAGSAAEQFASETHFDTSKDDLECALMCYALMIECPVLGICRGSQMLNVLRGGTLYGDLAAETGTTIEHLQPDGLTYDTFRHSIQVHGNTPLAHWFHESIESIADKGGELGELRVNSYHHQASKELGTGLQEMARAADGIIEAFYDQKYDPKMGHFVIGLQFHPERMLEDYPGCKRVYETFLRASSNFRQRADSDWS